MRARNVGNRTHYRVSGGPMMVTCHSNTLLSSTSPAEKPSTGFFERSASTIQQTVPQSIKPQVTKKEKLAGRGGRKLRRVAGIRTFELLLEKEAGLGRGGRHGGREVARVFAARRMIRALGGVMVTRIDLMAPQATLFIDVRRSPKEMESEGGRGEVGENEQRRGWLTSTLAALRLVLCSATSPCFNCTSSISGEKL
jgi:hypothetical protein